MGPSPSAEIDVIIPVFRGIAETRRCIESILAAREQGPQASVIVIDDATPEADLRNYLDGLPAQGVTVLRNSENVGFVATANKGFRLHPARDVVMLNSDTEVANDWLARLQRCAYGNGRVATVTPFSNNATICSYPLPHRCNELPEGYDTKRLDALFRTVNAGLAVDLPTAVGFCMFLRRDALDAIGLFDESAFGRGYGEENDFSMRASGAGWRNLAATDVFVYHQGHVSFRNDRLALQKAAEKELIARHPQYPGRVSAFIAEDPLAPYRLRVDRARVEADHAQLDDVLERYASWAQDERARLAEAEGAIRRHEFALSHAESVVANLEQGLTEVRQALELAERCVGQRDRENRALSADLVKTQAEVDRLTQSLNAAVDELHRMKNSRSWRYTAFLRRVRR